MQSAVEAYPPIPYPPTFWIVFWSLCAAVIVWYAVVFFVTRKKKKKSISTLTAKNPSPKDTAAIKQKYLALIEEVQSAVQAKTMPSRDAHLRLSYLLRFFAYEIQGIRAYTLTLSDLKKTRYEKLTRAIDDYYKPEFHEVEKGDITAAIATAREVVSSWS